MQRVTEHFRVYDNHLDGIFTAESFASYNQNISENEWLAKRANHLDRQSVRETNYVHKLKPGIALSQTHTQSYNLVRR